MNKVCNLAVKIELSDLAKNITQQIVDAGNLEHNERRWRITQKEKRHLTILFLEQVPAALCAHIGEYLVSLTNNLLEQKKYQFDVDKVTILFGKSTSLVPTAAAKASLQALHNTLIQIITNQQASLTSYISHDHEPHIALKRGTITQSQLDIINNYIDKLGTLTATSSMVLDLKKASYATISIT